MEKEGDNNRSVAGVFAGENKLLAKCFGKIGEYYVDVSPRHHGNGNSQASADVRSIIKRYNSLCREWRINMANKKNKMK